MTKIALIIGLLMIVYLIIAVGLHYYIYNYILTDEEKKECDEYVNRGENYSIYKNNPWDNWPYTFL